jgi:hypothetical protein
VGYDSNWGHNLTVHTVNHNDSYNQYILGILRKKSNNGGDMPITDEQKYRLIKGITGREAALGEITDPNLWKDTGFAIDTFWNNGGADRFANHSEAEVQQIIATRDGWGKIADQRFQNEKQVADLVGVSNPDDTNSVVAKVKDLQANQGGTQPTVLAPGVYRVN